jgi:hypothetical protein
VVRVGRSEAIDLFSKWSGDNAFFRCQGSFSNFTFSFDGRIASVNDSEMRLVSEHLTELIVRFTPELQYGYVDSREVSGPEKKFDSCLAIFFTPESDERNLIAFAPLDESV